MTWFGPVSGGFILAVALFASRWSPILPMPSERMTIQRVE